MKFKFFSLKKISSLKSLLLYWIIGGAICSALLYSLLMEYQFRFGVQLRTQAGFDWYANKFEQEYTYNKHAHLPSGPNLQSFLGRESIPKIVFEDLHEHDVEHRDIEFIGDDDLNKASDETIMSIFPICDGQPCEVLFFYSYQLNNGEWLYIMQGIARTDEIEKELIIVDTVITIITLLVLAIFGRLAFLLVQKVTLPVNKLADWADKLEIDSLSEHHPDFEYQELNQVANKLTDAFSRIRESVEKEHQFLQQVSHELRTPLATASGNVDILNLIAKSKELSPPERKAIDRLSFAIDDMRQLTETLLWLNRDHESLPDKSAVHLSEVVNEIVNANQYLLKDKQVDVKVSGYTEQSYGYQVLINIVLANLIRNAFQYTYEGVVTIEMTSNCITINNENIATGELDNSGDEVYGFGLGLHLVMQIAERVGWKYHYQQQPNGWHSSVTFDT